jgi:hypothetical protein
MDTDILGDITITSNKVRKKIQKLRPAAAAGPDGIGPRILQELEQEVVEGLTLIFKKSMSTGAVPADWRCANVTPIFKKGSRSDLGNYRPVSLTSVCCKLLESIIRDGLMSHLERNNLIRPSQHGFLPGRSCSTNLLEFLEKVTKEVDSGKPYDIVFLDFAKAFDKVPKNGSGKTQSSRSQRRSSEMGRELAEWKTTESGPNWEEIRVERCPLWCSPRKCSRPYTFSHLYKRPGFSSSNGGHNQEVCR